MCHRAFHRATSIPASTIGASANSRVTHRSVDLLARVYEYFLNRFAWPKGKNGGRLYTPSCVVHWLPVQAATGA